MQYANYMALGKCHRESLTLREVPGARRGSPYDDGRRVRVEHLTDD
jgi:hypothetical protein